MPKRKAARDAVTDVGRQVASHTLKVSKDVAIGATIAKTAPMWAPAAASALIGLGVLCLVLSLMCGGLSGIVSFVITDNFDTASFVGLIGFGVGGVSLPVVAFIVWRRARRHRLMQAVAPHTKHVTKHVKRHIWATLLGMFSK